MEEEKKSLHKSFGDLDEAHNPGLDFFIDRPHFALHKEGAIVRAEQEMVKDPENLQGAALHASNQSVDKTNN
jgi:hypothetical protein